MPKRVAVDKAGETCFQRLHFVHRNSTSSVGMEGPTRPQGGSSSECKEVAELDYYQRIMRSLTDSSTSQAAPSPQSTDQSGMGSSSYSFNDSYSRNIIPDISPGVNPWGFFNPPPPELRGLVADESSEPSWRTEPHPKDLSPIQREILADFPWLNAELDHRGLIPSASANSKEESDACTSVDPLEPSDQAIWAQSMLELQSFENSTIPEDLPVRESSRQVHSPVRFLEQALLAERSTSVTPANSETPFNSESLSSSLSDGEAELKQRSRNKGSESGTEAAGTSAQSGKRKRPEQEDGEDAPSDDQETKKPINRPRKKGGVKRVREPRYAIKTRTDTEVMDDGYKWRKYGQKAVKNSPHPRNYYRCTSPNCPVRKRVERCFDDPGLVVTTYEGTHTHQAPSFLRGPLGYPGGLQGLLATLSHHYNLAGNSPLPSYLNPSSTAAFPGLSSSDLYRSSPLWLSQLQPPPGGAIQDGIQENLNLLRAQEQQLLGMQQQEWASSIKNEPAGSFQFPGQGVPSFSSVSSLSDLGYDTRMSQYDSLANSSIREQLGTSQIINPLEYSNSLISNISAAAGPFSSAVLPDQSTGTNSSDSGLLEDMFRQTNPSCSRA